MRRCSRCGKELTVEGKTSRRDACPFCGGDLHICLNCRFYDPGAYNSCREPQAERVVDKERSNFCDFFVFREDPKEATGGDRKSRNALEDLFRKKE